VPHPQFPLQFDLISSVSAGGFLAHEDWAFITFIYELHEKWHNMGESELRQICKQIRMVSNGFLKIGDLGNLKG